MSTSLVSIRACAGLAIALLAVPACSRSVPTAPDSAGSAAAAQSRSGGDPTATYTLQGGTLNLSTAKGDTLSGDYAGTSEIRATGETATLTVTLTGGGGSLAGATGTLEGTGSGAFSTAGSVSLVLQGVITTQDGSSKVRISLKGRSETSCQTPIRVNQFTEGAMSGAGRVSANLSHLLGGTTCP